MQLNENSLCKMTDKTMPLQDENFYKNVGMSILLMVKSVQSKI